MNKKFLIIAASITVLVMILVLILSPKKNVSPPLPTTDSQLPPTRTELIDLSVEKRRDAMVYTASIEKKLPLYLKEFQTSGKTIIFTSHRPEEIKTLATRILVLHQGTLVFDGSPQAYTVSTIHQELCP